MFVRNCWYVIAWDHEVPRDGLFTRTVLGEAILLYRTADGEIVGLRDRCCHRLAPLSIGQQGRRLRALRLPRAAVRRERPLHRDPGRRDGAREGARAALSGRAEEQMGVRLDGRPGAAPTRPCCPTTSRATTRSGTTFPATCTTRRRSSSSATTCSTSRTSATCTRRRSAARPRSPRRAPTIEPVPRGIKRHAQHARRAAAAVLPRGAPASPATSTAGSSTTSSCPARC